MTNPPSDPSAADSAPTRPADSRECDDFPKLTAEEWAYIRAVVGEGDA